MFRDQRLHDAFASVRMLLRNRVALLYGPVLRKLCVCRLCHMRCDRGSDSAGVNKLGYVQCFIDGVDSRLTAS